MNSLKEFFLSFFESTKDRLKNPMLGAFVTAWIAINWRFLAILFFSNKEIEDKISFIESNYFDLKYNLWIPLAYAIFYVLILPYIMTLFDWLSQKGIATRKLISKDHRLADIQHRQEIAAEEWQLEKIRQGSPDISGLKEKVLELEALVEEKDDVIQKLADQIDSQSEIDPVLESTEEVKEEKQTTTRPKKKANKSSKGQIQKDVTKTETSKSSQSSESFPVMKDIVIRDLAKTEREWILIYALYSSDYGKKTLTREDLIHRYSESNRKTDSRIANLSNNLKTLIKSGQLKYINDDEMLLTSEGQEIAKEILNR